MLLLPALAVVVRNVGIRAYSFLQAIGEEERHVCYSLISRSNDLCGVVSWTGHPNITLNLESFLLTHSKAYPALSQLWHLSSLSIHSHVPWMGLLSSIRLSIGRLSSLRSLCTVSRRSRAFMQAESANVDIRTGSVSTGRLLYVGEPCAVANGSTVELPRKTQRRCPLPADLRLRCLLTSRSLHRALNLGLRFVK